MELNPIGAPAGAELKDMQALKETPALEEITIQPGLLANLSKEELAELAKLNQAIVAQKFVDAAIKKNNETLLNMGASKEEQRPRETDETSRDRRSDSAVLSRESRTYGKGEEEKLQLQLELEQKLEQELDTLEDWTPQPWKSLTQELRELKTSYQGLVQEILQNFSPDQQGELAVKLNQVLLEILGKLDGAKYPNLLALLERFGEGRTAAYLQAVILKEITGRTVYHEELSGGGNAPARGEAAGNQTRAAHGERQRNAGGEQPPVILTSHGDSPAKPGTAGTAAARPAAGEAAFAFKEEGVLYRRGEGSGVRTNEAFREQIRRNEQFFFEGNAAEGVRRTQSRPVSLHTNNYRAADVEAAEKFLRYFNQSGNQFENANFTAHNEELLGFLLAQNMIKAQVFAKHSGVGKQLGADVRDALERLSYYYMAKAKEKCAAEEDGPMQMGRNAGALDDKAVRGVYYYIMQLYQKTKSAQKALETGLRYAMGEFFTKKESKEHSVKGRYSEKAGFFSASSTDKSKRKEWEKGKKKLEKDWDQFLGSIGQSENERLQLLFSAYGPWGMMEEPAQNDSNTPGPTQPAVMILAAAVVLAIILAVAFFL